VHMSTLRASDVDDLMKQLADESVCDKVGAHSSDKPLYRMNQALGMYAT